MLAQKYRLKKRKDFERVYKQGKGFKQDFLFLKTFENNLKNSRIGIVVSKKIANRAVERNLIKRRLREAVKKRLSEMKPGLDIVIAAKQGISKKTLFQDIEQVLNEILLKTNIIEK